MLNMLTNLSPRLKFCDAEMLDIGVRLRNIVLPHNEENSAPFKASIFEVAPGSASPIDKHAVKEIWLIVKGHGDLHYDGKVYKAAAQDLFYFESQHSHQIINHSDELLIICSIYWP
jgi:mannose-6-phosphate isomerase-like protein (cupin superfamily)